MSSFADNLWSSVFTPGTNPTLLVATNVSFAALQVLLFALLIATYSIHFAILSVLCGGLWWAINWFATELKAAQAKEEEAEKLRRRKKGSIQGGSEWRSKGEVDDSADDEGEDTETEEGKSGMRESTSSLGPGWEKESQTSALSDASFIQSQKGGGSSTSAQQLTGVSDVRQRLPDEGDRSGEISTDSEWEKVSEQGDR